MHSRGADGACATFRHAKIDLQVQRNSPRPELAKNWRGLETQNAVPRLPVVAFASPGLTPVAVQQGVRWRRLLLR